MPRVSLGHIKINFMIDPKTLRGAKALAKARNTSYSEILRVAIDAYVESELRKEAAIRGKTGTRKKAAAKKKATARKTTAKKTTAKKMSGRRKNT